MKEEWNLPVLDITQNSGTEWLLLLLEQESELMRMVILMTLWRIWHGRNEVVHHKPMPTVESSRRFMCAYIDSLLKESHG